MIHPYHDISFYLAAFFSWFAIFSFLAGKAFSHLTDNHPISSSYLTAFLHWKYSELLQIALESTKSEGNYCNKRILHNYSITHLSDKRDSGDVKNLAHFRKHDQNHLVISHLKINSHRNKF